MPWVNLGHNNTLFLCFVDDKRIQLSKRPTMQSPFVVNVLVPLTSSHPGGLSNMSKVLQNNRATRRSMLHDTFTQNMVAVPVEAQGLPCQLFQVAFGTFCSFGLQFSLETEPTPIYFFPVPTTEKLL